MKKVFLSTLAVSVSMAVSQMAVASFHDDTTVEFESKTSYINQDNRSGGQDYKEAAQGFLMDIQSGYTDGAVGFGVDIFAGYGLKLDGSVKKDANGNKVAQTGLLPNNQKNYSKFGITAKAKYGDSVAKIGTLRPELPVLMHSNEYLMPQLFQGVNVEFNEIDNLSVTVGQVRRVNHVNSQDNEIMGGTMSGINGRIVNEFGLSLDRGQGLNAKRMVYAGATYDFTEDLSATYFFSNLKDNYKQHFLGLNYQTEIANDMTAGVDLRYFHTRDNGFTKGVLEFFNDVNPNPDEYYYDSKKLNNKTYSGMVNFGAQGHSVGLAYQKASGTGGFMKVAGTDSYLHNDSLVSDFAHAGEKSWQVRYGYDFAGVGLDGLTFGTSYVKGSSVDKMYTNTGRKGKEWERNTDVAYTFQNGAAKDLSLSLQNATYRSNFAGKSDEVRVTVSYPFSI